MLMQFYILIITKDKSILERFHEEMKRDRISVAMISRGFIDYLVGLTNALGAICDIHLYLTHKDIRHRHLFDSDKVNIRHIGGPSVKNIPLNIGYILRLIRDLKRLRPMIIHFQSGVLWELFLLHAIQDIPSIMTVHDVIRHPDSRGWKGLTPSMMSYGPVRVDKVIVHGNALKKLAAGEYEISPDKIAVIPHGIIERYGVREGRKEVRRNNILFFGNIDVYKGLEILVDSLKLIRALGLQVNTIVAGNCPRPEIFQALFGGAQDVELRMWYQSEEEVRALFEWADVLVLPYIEASQSGVLQIGFANGIPSVVTDVGSLSEVVVDGETGLVVPPRNPEKLAKAIVRILTDYSLREKIIRNMRAMREGCLSWQRIAEQTVEIYRNILGFNSP